MALTISQFTGMSELSFNKQPQLPDGPPTAVDTVTGTLALAAGTRLIRIKGTGSITWPNSVVEPFDGIEFRTIRGGQSITIA